MASILCNSFTMKHALSWIEVHMAYTFNNDYFSPSDRVFKHSYHTGNSFKLFIMTWSELQLIEIMVSWSQLHQILSRTNQGTLCPITARDLIQWHRSFRAQLVGGKLFVFLIYLLFSSIQPMELKQLCTPTVPPRCEVTLYQSSTQKTSLKHD